MKQALSAIAAFSIAAMLHAMPLALRIAAWEGDSFGDGDEQEIELSGESDETGEISLDDDTTLVLTNGLATAWSVALEGKPTVVLDDIPPGGKILNIVHGQDGETPATLVVGGVRQEGYSLVEEADALYAMKADAFSSGGKEFASFAAALDSMGDDKRIELLKDMHLVRRIDMGGATATLDLGGHTLSSGARWAFNVGDGSLEVANGRVECGDYGFYVCDGSLRLENCDVVAEGRAVQVHGAGTVLVAADARLETRGEDPVIFAVGGFGGKATVISGGALVQSLGSGEDTVAYDIAGNPNDNYGADFSLCGRRGVHFVSAADSCIHHPEGQGGGVEISGGWYSVAPRLEWLAKGLSLVPEVFEGVDGWRAVFRGMSIRLR